MLHITSGSDRFRLQSITFSVFLVVVKNKPKSVIKHVLKLVIQSNSSYLSPTHKGNGTFSFK